MRLLESFPQSLQRWISAHSPSPRTQTATGSITAPHAAARSPGLLSKCTLCRHCGQWLRCADPAPISDVMQPHLLQRNSATRLFLCFKRTFLFLRAKSRAGQGAQGRRDNAKGNAAPRRHEARCLANAEGGAGGDNGWLIHHGHWPPKRTLLYRYFFLSLSAYSFLNFATFGSITARQYPAFIRPRCASPEFS